MNVKNTPPATITAMLVHLRFNQFVVIIEVILHQPLTVCFGDNHIHEHLLGIRLMWRRHHIHLVVLVVYVHTVIYPTKWVVSSDHDISLRILRGFFGGSFNRYRRDQYTVFPRRTFVKNPWRTPYWNKNEPQPRVIPLGPIVLPKTFRRMSTFVASPRTVR